jgi:hypothetical protein
MYHITIYWIVLFDYHRALLLAFSLPFSNSINAGKYRNGITEHNVIKNTNDNNDNHNKQNWNSTTTATTFSHESVFVRDILHLSPADAYNRCVRGFRNDNLGLPAFLPSPVIENYGNERTGIGFILRRSPLALKEGIVHYDIDKTTGVYKLYYKVLNPSYTTFPVVDHLGTITLSPTTLDCNSTSSSSSLGCQLIWKVQWTPLFPSRIINLFVIIVLKLVINCACDYIAKQQPFD